MAVAHVAACNELNFFFSIIIRSEALVYNSFIFFRTAVLRKLLTFDSHTNTVISHALPPGQDGFQNHYKAN